MAVDIVHIVLNCFLTKVGSGVVEIQPQNLMYYKYYHLFIQDICVGVACL